MVRAQPKDFDLRFGLANLLLNAQRSADAAKVLEEIIAGDRNGPKGLQARGQLARLRLAEDRADETDRLVAEVLKENARDNAALLLRAQRSLQKNEPVPAIADLRAVLKDQPDSVELTVLLARAHLANKENDLARDTLARAVTLNPRKPQFRYLLASYLSTQKDYAGALREVDELLRERPGDTQALQATAEIQNAAGRPLEAEAALKRMIQAAPESPLGYYRLAQFYMTQNRNAAALAQLETAAANAPRDLEVLGALVRLMLVETKADAAVARLRQALKAQPEGPALHVMLGELLSAQKKYDEAAPLFRRAIELAPRLESAYVNLAQLQLAQRDAAGAQQLLEQGLKQVPRSLLLGSLLAEIHQQQGNFDGAIARYEVLIGFMPGNDLVANNLASLLSDHRNGDAAALARAAELSRRFEKSPNPLYLDTLGWVYYRRGDYAKAAEVLARAVQGADAPLLHYHLGMAMHRAGKVAEARQHLKKAAETEIAYPGRDEARALLVQG
jgi:predicted Zn-dependent protease